MYLPSFDSSANEFEVQAFKTKSMTGYSNALRLWHSNVENPYSTYKIKNNRPRTLERLIK